MKKITLYDYLELTQGDEVTVTDNEWDIETYFYKYEQNENIDLWDESIKKLSQLLTIKSISNNVIIVNLAEIIEKKLPQLKASKLFIHCNIDDIMEDIDSILAGNVSEIWLEKFVNILSE